jgi:glycine/D-amino acid oxidase-like deaminating enzyme
LKTSYDAVIIGAGFYGLCVALYLKEGLGRKNILILEKESSPMMRASYVNQARVHNGYHYPRSILTGARSAANFERFANDFRPAIVDDFHKHYAIAQHLSKVNANQFTAFCRKIGVPVDRADKSISSLFEPYMVEKVFKVTEFAFDSTKLKDSLLKRISHYPDITIKTGIEVSQVARGKSRELEIETTMGNFFASKVFNCTYAQINTLHRRMGVELVGLRHQITEMCLVRLPENIKNFSVTMMDGPFFSIMPFPPRGLHTLSHVRYTPHTTWEDNESTDSHRHDTYAFLEDLKSNSAFDQMKADVVRYIPQLKGMVLVDTLREVKTVLVKSSHDDSRPILFRSDFGIDGYSCIMGGKLDNVYDIYQELDRLYATE